MTAFAKGSTKRLDIIQAYKRLVTPLVGAELFTSSATEIREALTTQQLNAIQPALYAFVRAGIREQVEDSDVSGRAQSPEPGPARPSKARPEAGLGSGFQWAWAWLKVQKAQSPGLKPGLHTQLRKWLLNS